MFCSGSDGGVGNKALFNLLKINQLIINQLIINQLIHQSSTRRPGQLGRSFNIVVTMTDRQTFKLTA
jgi:hypothetical protein